MEVTDSDKHSSVWYHGKNIVRKKFILDSANVIKNTAVNYCGNFNPSFCRVKITQYIIVILG